MINVQWLPLLCLPVGMPSLKSTYGRSVELDGIHNNYYVGVAIPFHSTVPFHRSIPPFHSIVPFHYSIPSIKDTPTRTILFHQICSKAMMQHLSASGFADMSWKREEKTAILILLQLFVHYWVESIVRCKAIVFLSPFSTRMIPSSMILWRP